MREPTASVAARLADLLAGAAVAAVAASVALGSLRLVPALAAFRIFAGAALASLVLGLAALVRGVRGRRPGPAGAAAAVVGLVVVVLALRAARAPLINDVTTDLADPPTFRHAATLPANAGRDLGYPAAFAGPQRACCADLAPVHLERPPPEALALAADAARAMGWTVTAADEAAGLVEAEATTRLFGFRDDVVVRVRPEGAGSRVDVRSRSREGRSDLGANAARVRAYLAELRRRVAAR